MERGLTSGGGRRADCRRTTLAFREDLPVFARSLRQSLHERDVPRFALACKLIRDYAEPLGFDPLARAAHDAVASLRRTRSLDRSREEVAVLAWLCDRSRAA